jgi:hypothetical protein
MTKDHRYERAPDARASFMVPLGIHKASDGSLTFDPSDDELQDDLATMIRAFKELHPAENGDPSFEGQVKSLGEQRERMTNIMRGVVGQMGTPDGGDPHEIDTMLASAFDRFPQFVEFSELAAGCGDLVVDPLHEDRELADQISFTQSGDV